ncbi:tyrosine recombinase XerC [Burkholderia sp. L27(2015)]|jgi:integrase/recombinase XerC|uniref:tyrosine recombinase XerC n=1 Tax=Burkholderia sp. L27(2015) TaxID=1641858 RepID=UPI00131D20F3|nr:tyrosine recombinase XerC [Burkholderia sp. L27(2015)]
MSSADPIARFLDMLTHERKLSEHTLRGYAHELAELQTLAGERAFATLTSSDIRGSVVRAHSQDLSARSIAHRLSVWRSFYRWLGVHGEVGANPVSGIRAPKQKKTLPKALSADDAHTLMEAPDAGTPEALRDHAMLELFYSSGLRLAELIDLDVGYAQLDGYKSSGWIDLDAAEVTVTGKGQRRRSVPVGAKAIAALQAWLAVRPQMVRLDPHPLFVSARGKRMSPGVVRLRIKQMALAAGIPANVHPHVLRHSFATHVLQSSGDLRAVQEMLGHASITATQVYTALDFQHLAKIYDSAHPRAKKRDP